MVRPLLFLSIMVFSCVGVVFTWVALGDALSGENDGSFRPWKGFCVGQIVPGAEGVRCVVAIGQYAEGIIAVGQIAKGVIAIGQVAIGVVTPLCMCGCE